MKQNKEWEALIPGLPDEIAELCLLHVPYPYHSLIRSVSSSWNRTITNPSFKKTLNNPYLFVMAFQASRIQWQAFDPSSNRWFVLPSMPWQSDTISPKALTCASLPRQGKLFVMNTEASMRNTLVYHTATNQWSLAAAMPRGGRSLLAVEGVNGRIVTVGGNGTEIYDPESDTWRRGAGLGVEMEKYEVAVIGERMFVTEGWWWPFMSRPRGWAYDYERDTWREMREGMREGWTGLIVTAEGRLFVISEYGECPMKVYEDESDTWQCVGGGKFPREVMKRPLVARGLEDRIYVVSLGLNVAIGSVVFVGKEVEVTWQVVEAPQGLSQFSPSTCQVLYA